MIRDGSPLVSGGNGNWGIPVSTCKNGSLPKDWTVWLESQAGGRAFANHVRDPMVNLSNRDRHIQEAGMEYEH